MTHHRNSSPWDHCSQSPSLQYNTGNIRRNFRFHHHRTARNPLSHHLHIQISPFEASRSHRKTRLYNRRSTRHRQSYCCRHIPLRLFDCHLRMYQWLQRQYSKRPLPYKSLCRYDCLKICPWDRVRMMSGPEASPSSEFLPSSGPFHTNNMDSSNPSAKSRKKGVTKIVSDGVGAA